MWEGTRVAEGAGPPWAEAQVGWGTEKNPEINSVHLSVVLTIWPRTEITYLKLLEDRSFRGLVKNPSPQGRGPQKFTRASFGANNKYFVTPERKVSDDTE